MYIYPQTYIIYLSAQMDAALRSGGRLHGGGRRRGRFGSDATPGAAEVCGGFPWENVGFSWEKHGKKMEKHGKTWEKHGKTWQKWGFDGGFNGIDRKKPNTCL